MGLNDLPESIEDYVDPEVDVDQDYKSDEPDEIDPYAIKTQTGDEESEPWLISYADLMTLLMGLFVMLFSMAKIDNPDFESVKKSIARYFGGTFVTKMDKLKVEMSAEFDRSPLLKGSQIRETEAGLEIMLRTTLLFPSGSAEVVPEAMGPMNELIGLIKEKGDDLMIQVDGYTDDNPIPPGSSTFASNWELSGGRGATLVRMFESNGFKAERLMFAGYGETHPLFANRDAEGNPIPENQSKNRRVLIRVIKPDDSHVKVPAPAGAAGPSGVALPSGLSGSVDGVPSNGDEPPPEPESPFSRAGGWGKTTLESVRVFLFGNHPNHKGS